MARRAEDGRMVRIGRGDLGVGGLWRRASSGRRGRGRGRCHQVGAGPHDIIDGPVDDHHRTSRRTVSA